MRTSSQLILTFLLNATWQVALIVGVTSLCSLLLRRTSARYRHGLWVAALLLSVAIPVLSSAFVWLDSVATIEKLSVPGSNLSIAPPSLDSPFAGKAPTTVGTVDPAVLLNRRLAFALIGLYFVILLCRSLMLVRAWRTTRRIRRNSTPFAPSSCLTAVISKCRQVVDFDRVEILSSAMVPVPITIGSRRPVIILPQQLTEECNPELLMSAVGHEFVHVRRRDYFFNLLYELLYLPLSFNPAASLLRRRIRQTRELCCDEWVAERVLNAEAYARSLVKLASSAPPLSRLSVTTTVGIADADILEARIMSLLRKPKLNGRWKKISLVVVSLLLAVPCFAAASLAMRFDVDSLGSGIVQEPEGQQKEQEKQKVRQRLEESQEYNEGLRIGQAEAARTNTGDELEMRQRHREEELRARGIMQAALGRLAKIPMDQAVQIATSQQPGRVLECTLNAERWEELGKLAKDSRVFYHVVILSSEEPNPVLTHVLVNAVDGTVFKVETERQRVSRSPEPQ